MLECIHLAIGEMGELSGLKEPGWGVRNDAFRLQRVDQIAKNDDTPRERTQATGENMHKNIASLQRVAIEAAEENES